MVAGEGADDPEAGFSLTGVASSIELASPVLPAIESVGFDVTRPGYVGCLEFRI